MGMRSQRNLAQYSFSPIASLLWRMCQSVSQSNCLIIDIESDISRNWQYPPFPGRCSPYPLGRVSGRDIYPAAACVKMIASGPKW